MNVPQGRLRRQRVVTDLTTPLERALDDELTGYIRLEPQDTLLLDSEGAGVLTFDRGIPRLVYHTGTDNGGTAALTDIAVAGPCRVELYELDRPAKFAAEPQYRIPPGLPADRLVRDVELANRTRSAAADRGIGERADADALEAFLTDEERVGAIRREAREEARQRAEQWGLSDALVDPDGNRDADSDR
jgi:hypothetical protein